MLPPMPNDPSSSALDRLLRQAIAERRLVAFTLDGVRRVGEPHDYGIHKGVPRLLFYQLEGRNTFRPEWRWGELAKISDLRLLDDRFAGPRPAPSGRRVQWDALMATVSPRPVSPPLDGA